MLVTICWRVLVQMFGLLAEEAAATTMLVLPISWLGLMSKKRSYRESTSSGGGLGR